MRSSDTLTGRVVAPWSPGYGLARVDYNARFTSFYPDYVVYCQVTQDVERAIRWAIRHKLPFRIRSGGHSYEAYSLVNQGLVIDVSFMNHIDYDPQTGLAHIGAGARLLDVYQSLWDKDQVTIPGGSCPTVGIGGLTLGGGFGLISRQFGLTIDALTSISLVDAQGCLIKVSEHRHSDLFWALRGAGGNNFGVAVEFTFKAIPVANVAIFFLQWPWDHLPIVLSTFQHWADPESLDQRLTPILTLPSKQNGHVSIVGQFLGSAAELERLISPLLAIGGHTAYTVRTMSYIDAIKHFAGVAAEPPRWIAQGVPDHDIFKNTSAYTYQIFPKAAIDIIRDALSNTPGPACLVQLDGFGGRIRKVSPRSTAFFHRGARSGMQYQAYWTDPAVAKAHINWVEDFRRSMLPYTVGAYVNYCDSRIRDWPRAYYGENLSRLISIKRKWDPCNLFRFPQGLSEVT